MANLLDSREYNCKFLVSSPNMSSPGISPSDMSSCIAFCCFFPGFTPLILAATAGHKEVVEILLEHRADIEAQSERTKDTPLSLACSGGRVDVCTIIIEAKKNVEC